MSKRSQGGATAIQVVLAICIGGAIVAALASTNGTPDASASTPALASDGLDVAAFLDAYLTNPVVADVRYKGERIVLHGPTGQPQRGTSGLYVPLYRVVDRAKFPDFDDTAEVRCLIPKDREKSVVNFRANEQAAFRGKVREARFSALQAFVILEDCTFSQ